MAKPILFIALVICAALAVMASADLYRPVGLGPGVGPDIIKPHT